MISPLNRNDYVLYQTKGKEKSIINHNDYDLRIEIDYKICAVV